MYHPEIQALDSLANDLYAEGKTKEATQCQLKAGRLQQSLIKPNGRRYLNAQWVWAYGHIGLLQMLIRWSLSSTASTRLVLESQGRINNPYFLKVLEPYITIVDRLPSEMAEEAQTNAVYFACPDGIHSIHNFYKMVNQCTPRLPLTPPDVSPLLAKIGVERPFTALHARHFSHDPKRNISLQAVKDAIAGLPNVVSIGLDDHPINDFVPNVKDEPNPWLASFQLSAACDQFIGSNSGAWTVADAYGKAVTLMNDHEHKAWIYPEEINE